MQPQRGWCVPPARQRATELDGRGTWAGTWAGLGARLDLPSYPPPRGATYRLLWHPGLEQGGAIGT